MPTVEFQPSLFGARTPSLDPALPGLERIALDERAWMDLLPGWIQGSDRLFEDLLLGRKWSQRMRWMYDRKVEEPRLTSWWSVEEGPLEPPILEAARVALSVRYGVLFDSAGLNLYRDGRDSVAWHGDKFEKGIVDPIVALVSLGEPRRFLLRPKGGGRSRTLSLGRGDLLVTGGSFQREWQHSVPKVARAGPRISVAFRHGRYRAAS